MLSQLQTTFRLVVVVEGKTIFTFFFCLCRLVETTVERPKTTVGRWNHCALGIIVGAVKDRWLPVERANLEIHLELQGEFANLVALVSRRCWNDKGLE